MGVLWKRRRVRITDERIEVREGLRKHAVRTEDVSAVFTTMMPKGGDFQEVLAVEFFTERGGGVLALDPAWGFEIGEALDALREALGDRWDDLYLGHKHLSRVRGLKPPE